MEAMQERETNARGFLTDPGQWNPQVADALARGEGLDLTEAHWRMLKAIRNYFDENEVPPTYHVLRHEVEEVGEPFADNCVITMEHLFPRGGIKQACRIAGLPDYFCFGC
jgi:tRNA 2-thiouridine synthesizing protein E